MGGVLNLLWLHTWDFMTPIEEVMRAFDDLVGARKVLYIGISDTPDWIISQSNLLAELRGQTVTGWLKLSDGAAITAEL